MGNPIRAHMTPADRALGLPVPFFWEEFRYADARLVNRPAARAAYGWWTVQPHTRYDETIDPRPLVLAPGHP